MPKYNVQIEITYKSYHEDDSIEAKDEAEAEEIAKETCPVCTKTYSEDGEAPDDYFYKKVKTFNESDKTIYEP